MKEFDMDNANWNDFLELIVNTCYKSEFLFCSIISNFGKMLIHSFERGRKFENTGLMAGRFEVLISESNEFLPTLVKLWEPESDMVNMIILRWFSFLVNRWRGWLAYGELPFLFNHNLSLNCWFMKSLICHWIVDSWNLWTANVKSGLSWYSWNTTSMKCLGLNLPLRCYLHFNANYQNVVV